MAIKLNACARFPAGAIRIAKDAVIDQKIACAKATPMRLITRTVKIHGEKRQNVLEAARIELGMKRFLEQGGFHAFTTTFEDLHGLKQLPVLAVPSCQTRLR